MDNIYQTNNNNNNNINNNPNIQIKLELPPYKCNMYVLIFLHVYNFKWVYYTYMTSVCNLPHRYLSKIYIFTSKLLYGMCVVYKTYTVYTAHPEHRKNRFEYWGQFVEGEGGD